MARHVAVILIAATLTACPPIPTLTVEIMNGPDGAHDWAMIRCQNHASCLREAGARCPDGYRVASDVIGYNSSTTVNRWQNSVDTSAAATGQLMVHCNEVHPANPTWEDASRSPASAICIRAADHLDSVADILSAYADDDSVRLDGPTKARFVSECSRMPEPVQLCLNGVYERGHGSECEVVMGDAEPGLMARLVGVFWGRR